MPPGKRQPKNTYIEWSRQIYFWNGESRSYNLAMSSSAALLTPNLQSSQWGKCSCKSKRLTELGSGLNVACMCTSFCSSSSASLSFPCICNACSNHCWDFTQDCMLNPLTLPLKTCPNEPVGLAQYIPIAQIQLLVDQFFLAHLQHLYPISLQYRLSCTIFLQT